MRCRGLTKSPLRAHCVTGVTRDTRPLAVAACPAHGAHHLLGPTMHSVALGRRRQPKHCSLRGPDPFEAASSGRRRLLTRPRRRPPPLSAASTPFRALARAHFKPRRRCNTRSRTLPNERLAALLLLPVCASSLHNNPFCSLSLFKQLGKFYCARQLGRFLQYASQIRSCVKSFYNLYPQKARGNGNFSF